MAGGAESSFHEGGDQLLAADDSSTITTTTNAAAATTTTSFSQLLFSNDDEDDDHEVVGSLDMGNFFNYSCGTTNYPPKMLCFGGNDFVNYRSEGDDNHQVVLPGNNDHHYQGTNFACTVTTESNSSSASSGNKDGNCSGNVNVSNITTSKSTKKRSGLSQELAQYCTTNSNTTKNPLPNQRTIKKTKSESHAKGRREKLGERITVLQQLVSPFGKTDTASVLHEAMGYIRFLHDQVQVLSSPYLHHHLLDNGEENEGKESRTKDLRSRGLCLVPVESTMHVAADSNGADYWSPAAMADFSLTKPTMRR